MKEICCIIFQRPLKKKRKKRKKKKKLPKKKKENNSPNQTFSGKHFGVIISLTHDCVLETLRRMKVLYAVVGKK